MKAGVGLAVGSVVITSVILAACGGPTRLAQSTTTTAQTTTTPTSLVPAPTSTVPAPTTTNPPATLGLAGAWTAGVGFGQVEPSEVFLGGDPTGLVTSIHWQSWGGSVATGTGTSWYVAPNQITADGSHQTATIVAFDLGTCVGHAAYQEVEWYFPSEGGKFDPSQAVYACEQGYVNPNA